jgi:predicted ATPase
VQRRDAVISAGGGGDPPNALIGRDDVLALVDRRLRGAIAGHGELLLVAGEAGIGKTRLLASMSRRAHELGFAVLRAAAFADDAQASGSVLLDLASDMRRSPDSRIQGLGVGIAQRLHDPVLGDGDQHRRRRLLVHDLTEALGDLEADGRLLFILDDLQWADPLTLDVVGRLTSRLPSRRVLVVGAYRSDELFAGTPMRDVRTRLLSQRLAEEVRLARLNLEQTAELTGALLGRLAPTHIVATIYERSDGIPLHVEELLAATEDAATESELDDAAETARVPDTLADAVLRRASALDEAARDVAVAAAVIGRSFDFDLLTAVTARDAEDVDRCLRELQAVYFVQARHDGVTFDFRHALIRDALYADTPVPRRRQLHEHLSPKTVSAHISHILPKLGAARRFEIAAWATRVADSSSRS